MKDFNRFMYDHSLRCRREHFLSLLLTRFHYRGSLKRHIKDCFKNNGKETIKMPKKGEYLKFKDFERKIKSSFMIYADLCESILEPEDNGKQNQNESCFSKYQKHIACSCG